MNISDYDNLQKYENSSQIAIDFDGVVHMNSKGFHDGTVYDLPVEGAIESIKELSSKGFDIILFTAKVKPDRPLVNGKTGSELVWDWLSKYKIDKYVKEVTCEKPRALCYIDDKAIEFKSWDDVIDRLNNFF
jgi:hypothetical protein